MEWMNMLVLERPLATWLIAVAGFFIIAFGFPIIRGVIRRNWRLTDPADKSWKGLIVRLNDRWYRTTTLVIALVCAVFLLAPDPRISMVAKVLLIVVITIQAGRYVSVVVDWSILRLGKKAEGEDVPGPIASSLTGMRWVILFVAYSLILLLALQNLGIDVTALIAGLGIGGIAIALAMQNILGDLFASLTIALDKPFVVGDFIVVGNEMGTIEHVGLKTTRVRSLSGEQLVFGNSDLLSSRIRNFKRMSERRVVLGLGVVYSTTPDQLKSIDQLIRGAIQAQSNVRFDRCHFFRFGPSSLDFEAVYYISTPDYNAHMDTQEAVLLGIARSFRENGIDFAYPTQTLYLARNKPSESTTNEEQAR